MMAYFLRGVGGGGGHTKVGLPHINVWLDRYVPLVGVWFQYSETSIKRTPSGPSQVST